MIRSLVSLLTKPRSSPSCCSHSRCSPPHRARAAAAEGEADVRFERVTFGYAAGLPLFTGLDLAVPSGTTLGLVGRSGGGKTTLTRLLLRMMDVKEGRILIGGQDISKLRQSDLRGLIADVLEVAAQFDPGRCATTSRSPVRTRPTRRSGRRRRRRT